MPFASTAAPLAAHFAERKCVKACLKRLKCMQGLSFGEAAEQLCVM